MGKLDRLDRYIGIEELSGFLGVKKRTAYHLVETMQIPHYRIGRLIRFKLSEVEEWMASKKIEPAEVPYERVEGI